MDGKKIAVLRKERNLSQEKLANKLNVSRSTVAMWENNSNEPPISMLIKLTEILNVSFEEILSIKKEISSIEIIFDSKKIGEKIRQLRGNLSLRDFAQKCKISHTTIDNLEKGIDFRTQKPTQVTLNTLNKIASACNVSISYIIGENNSNIFLSDHELKVIEGYRNKPKMQNAVDLLLGVENNDKILVLKVAKSDTSTNGYILKDKTEFNKIKKAPETDDPLI